MLPIMPKKALGCSLSGAIASGILLTTGLLLPLQFGWSKLAFGIIGGGGTLLVGSGVGGYVILDQLEKWKEKEIALAKKRIFTIN